MLAQVIKISLLSNLHHEVFDGNILGISYYNDKFHVLPDFTNKINEDDCINITSFCKFDINLLHFTLQEILKCKANKKLDDEFVTIQVMGTYGAINLVSQLEKLESNFNPRKTYQSSKFMCKVPNNLFSFLEKKQKDVESTKTNCTSADASQLSIKDLIDECADLVKSSEKEETENELDFSVEINDPPQFADRNEEQKYSIDLLLLNQKRIVKCRYIFRLESIDSPVQTLKINGNTFMFMEDQMEIVKNIMDLYNVFNEPKTEKDEIIERAKANDVCLLKNVSVDKESEGENDLYDDCDDSLVKEKEIAPKNKNDDEFLDKETDFTNKQQESNDKEHKGFNTTDLLINSLEEILIVVGAVGIVCLACSFFIPEQ